MVSRKKILSRSRDDLDNLSEQDEDKPLFTARFEEDVWYTKQKLFSDHIEEIFKKWDSIDDEIWAKAIVMERNRRVAKAYARAPVLTINGGEGGFDGFRLGLNGFSNPMRDEKIEEFKETIGLGAKVKMDESGNILIKRLSKSPVFLKTALEDSSLSTDILGIANGLIELEKPLRIFDMRKFQQSINRELRRTNPDRVRLEHQCVVSLCFVKDEEELLDSPIWVVLINIVALEMLKAKLPQSTRVPMYKMHNGERRFPLSGSSDEDPYSLNSGHNSSGSSNLKEKEEKNSGILLKKEKDYFGPQNWSATQDRRRDRSRDNFLDEIESATLKPRTNNRRRFLKKTTTEDKKKKVVDDPYYCGFKARVPEFASSQQHTSSQPQQQNNNNTKELNGYKDKWVDKNNWIDREDREWTEAKERDPWEEPEDRKPMDKDRMWLEPTSGARDKEKMWMDFRPPVTKENNWTDTRAPISKDNMWTDSRPKYRNRSYTYNE